MVSNQSYYSLFAHHPEDLNFHLQSIINLLNVNGNIQVSPLCDAAGKVSPLLGSLMKALQEMDLGIEITQLDDGSGQHSNAVLKVWAPQEECALV